MILAGDVGGTNVRLAAFELTDNHLKPIVGGKVLSRDYAGLRDIVHGFIKVHQINITSAGFGVAGPVQNGKASVTNLPWIVDAYELASDLGLTSVALLNDLEANAYGIGELESHDFITLNGGNPDASGNAAVIAAGTGLGEAGLFWDGTRHHVFACEGGHADFAPRNAVEADLLLYLLHRWGHVSYERVLSGPGLRNIYEFLRDTGRAEEPAWLREELPSGDPSAAIAEAALDGAADLCVQALDLFVSAYGAEAGNLALKLMATGGVYIGGGIAPKILPKLRGMAFLDAFAAKGRMRPVLEAMPARVILNDQTALLGAARGAVLGHVHQEVITSA